jgi:hypothetical protein
MVRYGVGVGMIQDSLVTISVLQINRMQLPYTVMVTHLLRLLISPRMMHIPVRLNTWRFGAGVKTRMDSWVMVLLLTVRMA